MRAKFVRESLGNEGSMNYANITYGSIYPLRGMQYENSDNEDCMHGLTGDELECDVCAKPILSAQLENGLCIQCIKQGFWKDNQNRVRHGQDDNNDDIPKY